MLTELTSLSLIRIVDSVKDLNGISLLTNFQSFSWVHGVRHLLNDGRTESVLCHL